jgi:hypothetical protein
MEEGLDLTARYFKLARHQQRMKAAPAIPAHTLTVSA